jgi:hypothetical protein
MVQAKITAYEALCTQGLLHISQGLPFVDLCFQIERRWFIQLLCCRAVRGAS